MPPTCVPDFGAHDRRRFHLPRAAARASSVRSPLGMRLCGVAILKEPRHSRDKYWIHIEHAAEAERADDGEERADAHLLRAEVRDVPQPG
jgi:hypothetical protein